MRLQRRGGLEDPCKSIDELVIRVQQRIFDAFDHALHRQHSDRSKVSQECQQARFDANASTAATLLALVSQLLRRADQDKIVERSDASELLLIQVDRTRTGDLTVKECKAEIVEPWRKGMHCFTHDRTQGASAVAGVLDRAMHCLRLGFQDTEDEFEEQRVF